MLTFFYGNDIHVYTNCLILLFLCRYGNLETLTLLLGNGATKIIFFCAALPKYTKFGSTKQAAQPKGCTACFVRFHYDISQKMEKRNQFYKQRAR
jgi:hypothetical protein